MPLERFELEAVREPEGYTFLMRTIKTMQTVRVFVMDEALQGDNLISSEENLRAQFEADRTDFEAIAREKYKRGRVSENGLIVVTLADVAGSSSNTSGVSLYAPKVRGCAKTANA